MGKKRKKKNENEVDTESGLEIVSLDEEESENTEPSSEASEDNVSDKKSGSDDKKSGAEASDKEKADTAASDREEADTETSDKEEADTVSSEKEEADAEASDKEKSSKEKDSKKESDEELYKDEVYKEDEDSSDTDIQYLDLSSGSPVVIEPKMAEDTKKAAIEINPAIAIPWLLVLLGAGILISLTFNNNVWLDEAFTATLVNADMEEVLRRSMADTLPPLYNIILKLSTDLFGYTVPVMKITSAVPMILTMILGATVVRKRYGIPASCIFIIALTAMPNMLFFGVEIRMYSLGFLFATAAGIFAGQLVKKGGRLNWVMLTLSTVLAGYSHHFAFVTTGFIYLFILIYACIEQKKYKEDNDRDKHPVRIGGFLICLLATAILYFPCLLVTLKQFASVSGYFSMPEITLPVFIKYCRYPYTVGLTPLSIGLLALTLFLFIRLLFRPEKTASDYFSGYCLLIYYGVLLFGTLISAVMTANIFVDRYLFFSLGLIWLFFSTEASSCKKWMVYLIIIFELTIGIYTYTEAFSNEYAPGADETIKWLKENVSEGDSLYTLEESEELAWCLPFYDKDLTNYESLAEAVDSAGNGNVWIAVLDGFDDTPYMNEIEESGYRAEYISQFRFDRYMFKLYKLAQ